MPDPAVTLHRVLKTHGADSPSHVHDEAQLTFAATGMVQVHTDAGRWLVPPQLAVWVPAGVTHRVEVLTDAELWVLHWRPSALAAWAPDVLLQRGAFALRITPLLRYLLEDAFVPQPAGDRVELMVRLMLHELTDTTDAPTFLPWPSSPAGRRLASLALADRQNSLSLEALARSAATSVRSASRVFPRETGMSFKAWRQRARIVRSIERLGRGDSVSRVAHAAGFASTSAFSAAFRAVTTLSPRQWIEHLGTNQPPPGAAPSAAGRPHAAEGPTSPS